MTKREHPAAAIRRVLLACVLMPLLVAVAWWKALHFDPFTTSFFTRTYVAPSAETSSALRVFGAVVIAVGLLVAASLAVGLYRKRVVFREVRLALFLAWQVLAFGAAFFAAAERVDDVLLARKISS